MHHVQGIYWLLSELPIWAIAFLLYLGTMGVLFVLRDKYEGLYYQTSYSAQLGDGALIVVALMAAEILKQGVCLPVWLQSTWYNTLASSIATILGLVWISVDRPKEWGDRYHHMVVAPLLCYLGFTLLPVIYLKGNRVEHSATVLLILLWVVLVVYDVATHRLDQRKYHGLGEHLDAIKKEKR